MASLLRVGVIGVGNMGKNHMRILASMGEYELIGCFDSDIEQSSRLACHYGVQAFSCAESLFSAVDVVHIAAPSFLHRDYAVQAARAGCHILVEKPIALSVSDAQDIVDACDRAKVKLCVGHVERYNPAVITLRSILASEEIIAIDFKRMSPFDSRVSDASVVQDLMIHDVDIMCALLGPVAFPKIASMGVSRRSDKLDFVHALLCSDSGVVCSLTSSRVTESKIRTIDVHAEHCFIHVNLIDRSIEVSRKTHFSLDVGYPVQYKQDNVIERVLVPIAEPLKLEFEHFARAIVDDLPIETNGHAGKMALQLCESISEKAIK